MKLSTRLILFFLLLSLVPFSLIGYIGFQNGIDTIKQDTIKRLVSTNISKEAEVNRWIKANKSHLRALAQRPLVREYAFVLCSDTTDEALRDIIKKKIVTDHFEASIQAGIGFVDLSILDIRDGQIVVSTDKRLVGKYREDELFFVEGQRRTFVDEVTYALTTEQLVMHVSTPVRNETGELIAVLAGHVNWKEMTHIMLQSSGMSQSEESYLVNKFNYFVTESRFATDYPLRKTVYTKGTELCLAQVDGIDLYDDYRGIPVIGAYRWMPEWGLCILTEENQSEAFAPAVTFRNVVVGVSVVVGILAMALSIFFARTITTRIAHLVKGAEAFSKGNFDFKIPSDSQDELGLLAHAFNNMAQARKKAENTIKRSRDELEERVEERTAEIVDANIKLRQEIKERWQIEDALRKNELEYRNLVNNLDTAVVVHATDTQIVLSNYRSHELLGLSEEQIIGKKAKDPIWHFVREDGTPLPLEAYPVNQVIASYKPLQNYILGIDNIKLKHIVWVMVNAFPKFGDDKKIEQVVVTFWDITYRKAAEEKIQRSLHEKEVLLREIHHRVKNNMQMIQSLLNLQATNLGNPTFKASLIDSNSRIKSMALIHETLYRSEDIAKLDLDSYFRQLVKHLYKIYIQPGNCITPIFSIEPLELDMDASIACGLILNELVTNALKYAFTDSNEGIVKIGLKRSEKQEAILEVSDNGVGLPKDDGMEMTPSLGLRIVSMLAEDQLQGEIRIERRNGTTFEIRFPISSEA